MSNENQEKNQNPQLKQSLTNSLPNSPFGIKFDEAMNSYWLVQADKMVSAIGLPSKTGDYGGFLDRCPHEIPLDSLEPISKSMELGLLDKLPPKITSFLLPIPNIHKYNKNIVYMETESIGVTHAIMTLMAMNSPSESAIISDFSPTKFKPIGLPNLQVSNIGRYIMLDITRENFPYILERLLVTLLGNSPLSRMLILGPPIAQYEYKFAIDFIPELTTEELKIITSEDSFTYKQLGIGVLKTYMRELGELDANKIC